MSLYAGYQLDVSRYDLTNREIKILNDAVLLVDNGWSLRKLSRNVLRSKSQLSRDFQKPLRTISYELWQRVQKTYQKNMRYKK